MIEVHDTLWDISERYVCEDGGPPHGAHHVGLVRELYRLNSDRIEEPDTILPGVVLCLPREVVFSDGPCTLDGAPFVPREQAATAESPSVRRSKAEPEVISPEASEPEPSELVEPEPSGLVEPEPSELVEPEPSELVDPEPSSPGPDLLQPSPRPSRVGLEFVGAAHVPLSSTMSHVYSTIGGGEVGVRVPLVPRLKLRFAGRFSGGRQSTTFNSTPTRQDVFRGGGSVGLWWGFAGKRRVTAHAGLEFGGLWIDRRLIRRDLPLEKVERQVASSLIASTGMRIEAVLSANKRWKFTTIAALDHMAVRVDGAWTYDPQLTLSGGIVHDF